MVSPCRKKASALILDLCSATRRVLSGYNLWSTIRCEYRSDEICCFWIPGWMKFSVYRKRFVLWTQSSLSLINHNFLCICPGFSLVKSRRWRSHAEACVRRLCRLSCRFLKQCWAKSRNNSKIPYSSFGQLARRQNGQSAVVLLVPNVAYHFLNLV